MDNSRQTCTLRYIIRHVSKFKFSAALMLFGGIFCCIKDCITEYIFKLIIDTCVMSEINIHTIYKYSGIYIGLILIDEFLYRIGHYFVTVRMVPLMRANIILECINSLNLRSYNPKEDKLSGEFAAKVKDISDELPNMVTAFIDQGVLRIVGILFSVATLFIAHWIFGFILLTWLLIFTALSYFTGVKVIDYARNYANASATISGKITDILSNALSVKLFAAHKYEILRMGNNLKDTVKKEKILQRTYSLFFMLYNISTVILKAVSLFFLCHGLLNNYATAGDFYIVISIITQVEQYATLLFLDFNNIIKTFGRISKALVDIMKEEQIIDIPKAIDLTIKKGEICFNNITFGYSEDKIILKNFSLHIKGGEKIGIVSQSGVGKSTLINLLLRLYNLIEGSIEIDGQDISKITQNSLRNNIGVIPQEPILFNRSIRDNILYGNFEATDEQIIEAAKHAHVHEFIINLPLGYATLAGERGSRLSGGQRQRIVIARAILKNTPILILDEATSALDAATEDDIEESIAKLSTRSTTIVISHRLCNLIDMHRIIVIGKEGIMTQGSHEELLKICPLYIELWKAQTGT